MFYSTLYQQNADSTANSAIGRPLVTSFLPEVVALQVVVTAKVHWKHRSAAREMSETGVAAASGLCC